MSGAPRKSCAILLGMGGPDSEEDVGRFLYNIFCDRAIIRLPGGPFLQKPFARLISSLRTKKVRSHYAQIGGGSPLLKWTQAQADQVQGNMRAQYPEFACFVAMRYFTPYIEIVIKEAYQAGYRDFCFVPMYPQYCAATTGSSFGVARVVCESYPDIKASFVSDFHNEAGYIELLRSYIADNIGPEDYILFSAHSLPKKFVDEGDPYVEQTMATAKLAAGEREHSVAFQSRSGPVKWVGPDTVDEVKRLLIERDGNLFIVPISFLCDHIETLYEIDIELAKLVGSTNAKRLKRMPMFNDDPRFAKVLTRIISNWMRKYE